MFRSALASAGLLVALPAAAQPYGHMDDWGYGYGPTMMFGPVIWILVLGLVVAGVVWFVRQLDGASHRQGRSKAIEELDLRLARGEIDVAEHAAKKKALMA